MEREKINGYDFLDLNRLESYKMTRCGVGDTRCAESSISPPIGGFAKIVSMKSVGGTRRDPAVARKREQEKIEARQALFEAAEKMRKSEAAAIEAQRKLAATKRKAAAEEREAAEAQRQRDFAEAELRRKIAEEKAAREAATAESQRRYEEEEFAAKIKLYIIIAIISVIVLGGGWFFLIKEPSLPEKVITQR